MNLKKKDSQTTEIENQEITESKRTGSYIVQDCLIFFATLAGSAIAGSFYDKTVYEITAALVLTGILCLSMLFVFEQEMLHKELLFRNAEHRWSFVVIYLFCLIASLFFPLLPGAGWPFLAIFLALLFFSGKITAIMGGSCLLCVTLLLSEALQTELFYLYFTSGIFGIFLLCHLQEGLHIGKQLVIVLLIQFLCLSLHETLLVNAVFSFELFIVPFLNTAISAILILLLVKHFSVSEIYRVQDVYMELNDPEHPLLVQLKERSKEEYFRAVHTAYLCDRVTDKLHMDREAAKAAGYYHRIGILTGKNEKEPMIEVMKPYPFPKKVTHILSQYLDQKNGTLTREEPLSKETVVLVICDSLVSAIRYYFDQNQGQELDYAKLIQAIFERNMKKGLFDQSEISLFEINRMKEILIGEKLYYDFLR